MEINNFSNVRHTQPKIESSNHQKISGTNNIPSEVKSVKKDDVLDVIKKIDSVNQFLKSANTNIKFNLHEDLNEYYITIVDEVTNEVVKEVPPKKLLDIYAAMVNTVGLFVDKKI